MRLFPLALLALTACAPSAPRLQLPIRTEANCESRAVKQTAIDSIVASIDDTVRPGTYPGDGLMRKAIKAGGGVFAYWRDQPFPAPDTAKALGITGTPTLKRAVITNQVFPAGKEHYRPVWLTFATPKGDAVVLERAYDVQNVCIEGRREI
ncbi:MAG: hypothetical protein M3154_07370 [Candidatus Eremiobacteraeota bacterium]|nr:hypothetical protein [Candidatus Eremiobacteraeota bacterium]